MKTKVAALACLTLAGASMVLAQESQQEHMLKCNMQAGDLKGDERKTFMNECLSKPSPPTPAQKAAVARSKKPGASLGMTAQQVIRNELG